MTDNLRDLTEYFKRQNIVVLLIGGYAMEIYGVIRQTLDIDFLISDEYFDKIKKRMSEKGYRLIAETENFMRFYNFEASLSDIDFLVVNETTFENLFKKSKSGKVGTAQCNVPSVEHLIALKLHAIKNNPDREARDIADIVELTRKNSSEITSDTLKLYCDEYGPENIFEKIRKYLK